MFPPGWSVCLVLLTLLTSAGGLEISGSYKDEVICSQGLSRCSMKDKTSFPAAEHDTVGVQKLAPHFKLCCKNTALCTLCLVIDTELDVHLDKSSEDHRNKTRNTKDSVTVCYKSPSTFPMCKKVKFIINRAAFTQQNPAKMSMVIIKPVGVFFSSEISVYASKSPNLCQQVVAPSKLEVCVGEEEERVEECQGKKKAPRLRDVVYQGMNWVELRFAGRNKSLPSMCIQYEPNGACQIWNRTMLPLSSVTSCMCLQVWREEEWRLLSCPFKNKGATVNVSIDEFIQRNVWQNVSVSLGHGRTSEYNMKLWWNLSAPCKLEGEVWPCHQEHSCREEKGFRQQLENGTWKQNGKGLWEKQGVFENVSLHLAPCVMVKLKGLGHELGPFCFNKTGRWRWTLLLVTVTLLVCVTVLVFYLLNDFIKKWVRSCRHGRFVNIGRKGHVVLLSPPDVDDGVSESVCRLGSLLCNRGFSVCLDQWSRKEQCTLGPLPWLHSQLLELNSLGGRVVLVLTHKALVRTAEWSHQHPSDSDHPQASSPYSDVFTACLCLIKAEKQLGRTGERFVLVTFVPYSKGDRSLPELLQGLPLFQLPSQIQALLSELCVRGTRRGLGGRT